MLTLCCPQLLYNMLRRNGGLFISHRARGAEKWAEIKGRVMPVSMGWEQNLREKGRLSR